nr:UvrB/UvrC motif-containing protein [Bacillus licheniformis]
MKRSAAAEQQEAYNEKHGITPKTINKKIRDVIRATHAAEDQEEYQVKEEPKLSKMTKKEREKVIAQMESDMKEAAKALDFERAELRDLLLELKSEG